MLVWKQGEIPPCHTPTHQPPPKGGFLRPSARFLPEKSPYFPDIYPKNGKISPKITIFARNAPPFCLFLCAAMHRKTPPDTSPQISTTPPPRRKSPRFFGVFFVAGRRHSIGRLSKSSEALLEAKKTLFVHNSPIPYTHVPYSEPNNSLCFQIWQLSY